MTIFFLSRKILYVCSKQLHLGILFAGLFDSKNSGFVIPKS